MPLVSNPDGVVQVVGSETDFGGCDLVDVGLIKFRGPQYTDYLVGGAAIQAGASGPDRETFRDSIEQRAFDGAGATESAHFAIHLSHDIRQGTVPTFHIHWGHKIGAPTGNVKWQLEVTAARGYGVEVFPASATLSTVSAAAAQYVHVITDDDDMPMPAALAAVMEPDMLVLCRVFRDSGDVEDTFADDAFLFFVDMHVEIGQSGTTERNRPFDSAGF